MLQVYGSSPNVNVGWCALCLALRVYARWRMCGACKRERAERGRGSSRIVRARKRDGLLILCCVLFGNIVLSTATLRVDKGIGLSPSNAARGLTRGRACIYTSRERNCAHMPSCRRRAPHSHASPVLLILFTRLLRLLDPILVDLHPWSKLAPALIHEAQ